MSILSVIVITKNAAKHLAACLKSVAFSDEIIVVDSGSEDETVSIARKFTTKVYVTDWPGFGIQKNRALKHATGDWVLSLDADEVITPDLATEIKAIVGSDPDKIGYAAYLIPRQSYYCKRIIRHGDWRNDEVLRLFNPKNAHFKEVPVHEKLIVDGKVGKLTYPILHNSFENLEEVIAKLNLYSSLSANAKHEEGKKTSILAAILRGLWTFFRGYILKAGFLDGKEGFMLAISNAEGCYYRYLKLMLLQKK